MVQTVEWDGQWDMDTWLGQERSPLDCPNGPWESKTVTKDCDGKLGHHSTFQNLDYRGCSCIETSVVA